VLCALAFHQVFAAGASYYGVSDLEALAKLGGHFGVPKVKPGDKPHKDEQ